MQNDITRTANNAVTKYSWEFDQLNKVFVTLLIPTLLPCCGYISARCVPTTIHLELQHGGPRCSNAQYCFFSTF